MLDLNKIIGLKVLEIRGFSTDKRIKHIYPQFILFNDKKTYISLEDQCFIDYHDCDGRAKIINISIDKKRWKDIFNDLICYPKATEFNY